MSRMEPHSVRSCFWLFPLPIIGWLLIYLEPLYPLTCPAITEEIALLVSSFKAKQESHLVETSNQWTQDVVTDLTVCWLLFALVLWPNPPLWSSSSPAMFSLLPCLPHLSLDRPLHHRAPADCHHNHWLIVIFNSLTAMDGHHHQFFRVVT